MPDLNVRFFLDALSIILIDILLAGDNAVVIAMAVRSLPKEQRRLGIAAGSAFAVVLRIALTFFAAQLLQTQYLKLIGGLAILWIAVKLLADSGMGEEGGKEAKTMWQAMWLIIVADITMSVDNILAVAAASKGHLGLLIFGLGMSIPFVVFTSRLLSTLMDKYPVIVYIGSAILGRVGGEMIFTDLWVVKTFGIEHWMVIVAEIVCGAGVVALGWWLVQRGRGNKRSRRTSDEVVLVRCVGIALELLSLLVPEAGERERWRARWSHSLGDYVLWLESRGLPRGEIRTLLGRYLRDGATEALAARWPVPQVRDEWLRKLRMPWVTLLLPFAALALGLWWSSGASLLRSAFRPISPALGDRLVTAVPERSFFGKVHGFTPRQFSLIRERATSYSAIGGYAIRWRVIEGQDRRVAVVTPGLFTALGLSEGQTYVAEHLGVGWIGRLIQTGGRSYRITGIWPRHLRQALARPDFWISELPDGFDATMVAILKPGVTHEAASRELRDLLLSAPPRKGTGTPTAVIPLRHTYEGVLRALWIGFLTTVVGLAGYAIWCAVRRNAWRMELFFLAKTLPLLTGLFCCSVAGFGLLPSATVAGPFFILWLTGIGAVLGIWWARRDQQLRCPQCLTRMTLSVQIGTHGAALLEGVGDELLCEYGHGSLWLPGAASQAFGPEVWRSQ